MFKYDQQLNFSAEQTNLAPTIAFCRKEKGVAYFRKTQKDELFFSHFFSIKNNKKQHMRQFLAKSERTVRF